MSEVLEKASRARKAYQTYFPSTEEKNGLLTKVAKALVNRAEEILKANEEDVKIGRENGTSEALLDRLTLTLPRISQMAEGVLQIVELNDPINQLMSTITKDNGLVIEKRRVPLGVIGIIYEARPNVTVDAASLCLKTGNAVVLRGGSAASHSNRAIIGILHDVMAEVGFNVDFLQYIEETDRSSVMEMLKAKEYIDVIIPRGGRSLIKHVVENSLVPVIETGEGICHLYIHREANLEMAKNVLINAKCQRPSVCNAIETLLVDSSFASLHLTELVQELIDRNVEVRGCAKTMSLCPKVQIQALEEDWQTEYSDYILSVKIVSDVGEAVLHIARYGTKHSESIITDNQEVANDFMMKVDAAAVYHNASTRFTDGFEFGFGAEIGISTQKIHARGPMGLPELTSYKYFIKGSGQIRI